MKRKHFVATFLVLIFCVIESKGVDTSGIDEQILKSADPSVSVRREWRHDKMWQNIPSSHLTGSLRAALQHYDHKEEETSFRLGRIIETCFFFIRKQGGVEVAPELARCIVHPTLPSRLKAKALKCYMLITKDEKFAERFLKGNDDVMRATALETITILCPEEPFDAIVARLDQEKNYSQTHTGIVLSRVRQRDDFRDFYNEKKGLKERLDLIVQVLPGLCAEPPTIHEEWYIGDDAYAQYLLREYKKLYGENPESLFSAVSGYVKERPQWKPLASLLLLELGVSEEDATNLLK